MNELHIDTFKADTLGLFVTRPAADWMASAAARPMPRRLWGEFWFEGEACCLFADTNVGKSIYAVQIGEALALQGHHVLYFDFELSDKQFQMRYTAESTAEGTPPQMYGFSPRFLRVELGRTESLPAMPAMIDGIAAEVARTHADIVIVDNLTWLCNGTESGDVAGMFMQELTRLKRELKLSILVLAHTPKRSERAALTVNSLAGSKRLANFFDSIFALGIDHTRRPAGRYLKQIKVRSAELRYGADSVMQAELRRQGPFLLIDSTGCFPAEISLLEPAAGDASDLRERILEMRRQGMSLRTIAESVGISHTSVQRLIS